MDTQLKPQIDAYIGYQWKDHKVGEREEHEPGEWKLIGWDTVDEDTISVFQKMIGTSGVQVYLWEFSHPTRTLYRWNDMSGWVSLPLEQWHWIPQDLQMKALVGAL